MPWWGILLIVLGSCALTAGVFYFWLAWYLAKGMRDSF